MSDNDLKRASDTARRLGEQNRESDLGDEIGIGAAYLNPELLDSATNRRQRLLRREQFGRPAAPTPTRPNKRLPPKLPPGASPEIFRQIADKAYDRAARGYTPQYGIPDDAEFADFLRDLAIYYDYQ